MKLCMQYLSAVSLSTNRESIGLRYFTTTRGEQSVCHWHFWSGGSDPYVAGTTGQVGAIHILLVLLARWERSLCRQHCWPEGAIRIKYIRVRDILIYIIYIYIYHTQIYIHTNKKVSLFILIAFHEILGLDSVLNINNK